MKRPRLVSVVLLALLIVVAAVWITIRLSSDRQTDERAERTDGEAVTDNAGRVFKPDTSPPRFSRE